MPDNFLSYLIMYMHISLFVLAQSALGLSIAGHIESFDEIKHSPHLNIFYQ